MQRDFVIVGDQVINLHLVTFILDRGDDGLAVYLLGSNKPRLIPAGDDADAFKLMIASMSFIVKPENV